MVDIKKYNLPDAPGVYYFLGVTQLGQSGQAKPEILYIGKATSLKDRVRSYFKSGLSETRGPKVQKMLDLATDLKWQETDSVLEALILEAKLIKKHQPAYNTREKDDKSYWFVVITKEDFPRVLMVRGRELEKKANNQYKVGEIFGPFPYASELKAALKIIRKIFPYRDTCFPLKEKRRGKELSNDPRGCFNSQLGLCPGVCTGQINQRDYCRLIKNLTWFFAGRKEQVISCLEKEMFQLAKAQKFEEAGRLRDQIFALKHIQDVSLLKDNDQEIFQSKNDSGQALAQAETKKTLTPTFFRLEAYDVAHLAGAGTVGGLAVWEGRELNKSEYRLFRLRGGGGDDINSLAEVLRRRFAHQEWQFPDLIVIDGGQAQLNIAKKVLSELKISRPLVSVVKDEKHRPRDILGNQIMAKKYRRQILATNADVHRFVLANHRKILRRMLK